MKRELAKLVSVGHYTAALLLYSRRRTRAAPPGQFTFPRLLKACGNLESPIHGQIFHAHLIKLGFHQDTYAGTSLTTMYMKFNRTEDAVKSFDEMPTPNVASVTATISGFSQNGRCEESLVVFREVAVRRFRPNSIMIASVLSACDDVEHGRQVHSWAVKLGVRRDVFVGTAMVTMYMGCGDMVSAAVVFGSMEDRNVVSYNAFLSGLLQNGVNGAVLKIFKDMLESAEVKPNSVTFVSVFGACRDASNNQFGRQVHGFVLKTGTGFDTVMGTALVDMYCRCGHCPCAYDVFTELKEKRNLITWNSMISGMMMNNEHENAVALFAGLESEGLVPDSATWNTMISGFSQLGIGIEALTFFKNMQSRGIAPNLKSLTSILPACSTLCCLKNGKEVHGHTIRKNINDDELLATSLIDMYMKCGESTWARRIFDQIESKPVVPALWNAMISGYGRNGGDESAFEIFHLMQEANIQPNSITFLNLLSVCSYNGEIDKGLQVFRIMVRDYGLIPAPQHYACMIDLLGRGGQLDKAKELLDDIPHPSASALSSLVSASGSHLDAKVDEDMVKNLVELESNNSAPFVALSNIYAALGRWKDVERIRHNMDAHKVKKNSGYSLHVI